MNKTKLYNALTVLIAISISLVIAFIILLLISPEPLKTLSYQLIGPLTATRYITQIIERTSTLVFTGLAITIMFRAAQFNVGAEGSFYLGAVAATAVALSVKLPGTLHIIVIIAAAALAGAVFCAIPGFIKHKWGADEFVVSVMMNYIALFLGLFIVNRFYLDSHSNTFGSLKMPATVLIGNLSAVFKVHAGVFIMIAVTLLICFYLFKTKQGYQLYIAGQNRRFADCCGIKTGLLIVMSQALGGAVAGIGGAVELLGMYSRFQWFALPGYGWDGVIVAILARNNPALVPVAALFLAYLRVGSDIMALRSDVPAQMITVLQAIMIMLVTSSALITSLKRRGAVREVLKNERA